MSFSKEVKEEIVSHTFTGEQIKALLSGFVKYNAELIYSNTNEKLKLSVSSNKIARSLFVMCKEFFVGQIEISIVQSHLLKKSQKFILTLIGDINKFLNDIHIYTLNNDNIIKVSSEILDDRNLTRAYIAGIFIAIGSVNSPETSNYHLELQFKDESAALSFNSLLSKLGFNFKLLKRNDHRFVCYIKKSTLVSDFLKLIDAGHSVMEFENQRISREMYNNQNRMMNIDISNQTKALIAAEKQIEQIKKIKQKKMFYILSDKAKALAEIRLQNPEATFRDLEEMMNKKGFNITKSGVSNLFKTIAKCSEEL